MMQINTENLVGTHWRHNKRDFTYEVIFDRASMQCSTADQIAPGLGNKIEDYFEEDHFIVYRSDVTGHIYVRPRSEFLDGRFERLP